MSIYLHFPLRKNNRQKTDVQNKITRLPDTKIPESTWEVSND